MEDGRWLGNDWRALIMAFKPKTQTTLEVQTQSTHILATHLCGHLLYIVAWDLAIILFAHTWHTSTTAYIVDHPVPHTTSWLLLQTPCYGDLVFVVGDCLDLWPTNHNHIRLYIYIFYIIMTVYLMLIGVINLVDIQTFTLIKLYLVDSRKKVPSIVLHLNQTTIRITSRWHHWEGQC